MTPNPIRVLIADDHEMIRTGVELSLVLCYFWIDG